uniref:Uncharacterized protein n=1 Tax=Chromera velia CCMP2878 TaxID=1169474 RepID=A0A0G4HPZ4_9ALVE|eukprot:Cvel_7861.t1-p1 / transcript=Cvel_7861.t1 / gene=Cvel_7861 / organism=Chromera_velia_CCMP2878 / gene_product=hypothetical protein / transcript_product=hypothetical protein / location=Cvel_scaffold421:19267-25217(-) / protein_length=609 / sequence_SO=supercontig / SO=protein_coding / is_pseudo=false
MNARKKVTCCPLFLVAIIAGCLTVFHTISRLHGEQLPLREPNRRLEGEKGVAGGPSEKTDGEKYSQADLTPKCPLNKYHFDPSCLPPALECTEIQEDENLLDLSIFLKKEERCSKRVMLYAEVCGYEAAVFRFTQLHKYESIFKTFLICFYENVCAIILPTLLVASLIAVFTLERPKKKTGLGEGGRETELVTMRENQGLLAPSAGNEETEEELETETKKGCGASFCHTLVCILSVILVLILVVTSILTSCVTLWRFWAEVHDFHQSLKFGTYCNFLLMTHFMSYKDIVPLIVLGAFAATDVILFVTAFAWACGIGTGGCCVYLFQCLKFLFCCKWVKYCAFALPCCISSFWSCLFKCILCPVAVILLAYQAFGFIFFCVVCVVAFFLGMTLLMLGLYGIAWVISTMTCCFLVPPPWKKFKATFQEEMKEDSEAVGKFLGTQLGNPSLLISALVLKKPDGTPETNLIVLARYYCRNAVWALAIPSAMLGIILTCSFLGNLLLMETALASVDLNWYFQASIDHMRDTVMEALGGAKKDFADAAAFFSYLFVSIPADLYTRVSAPDLLESVEGGGASAFPTATTEQFPGTDGGVTKEEKEGKEKTEVGPGV